MDKKLCKKKSKNNIMRIMDKAKKRKRIQTNDNSTIQSYEEIGHKILQGNEHKEYIKEET